MTRPGDVLALLVAPLVAIACLIGAASVDRLLSTVAPVLFATWLAMILAVGARWIQAMRAPGPGSSWRYLRILTGAGRSMMWAGAGAIAIATLTGWASVSVLGVLGLATAQLAVTWTALVAGSDAPFRGATIERTLEPDGATEGDPARERVRVRGVRIPAGMRLFAAGRAFAQGPQTRYAIGSEASRGELELESDLGPAPRGQHRSPPLAWWLGDVLGLARGPIVFHGEAELEVLPRAFTIDGVRALLGRGDDAAHTRPVQHMPTEGTFRIREYAPGDDTRRIHWVRSLQADRLVVRLPDEVPDGIPEIRVVLDSCLRGAELLSCSATGELLDALVRIWLGIGKALARSGARVTMVAAVDSGAGHAVVQRPMVSRAPREAFRLGARVRWQDRIGVAAMLSRRSAVRDVVVTARPTLVAAPGDVLWVIAPLASWTRLEADPPAGTAVTLPYPIGSADNRAGRRAAVRRRTYERRLDREMLAETLVPVLRTEARSRTYVARPGRNGVALEAAP